MGYYATLIASGKYKRWKRHRAAIHPTAGPIYDEPEISPAPNSEVKYNNILRVLVVDDIGLGTGNFYWYIYLYDFVKKNRVETKTQYIVEKGVDNDKKTVYYDQGLDEKLGGQEQKTGGQ